MIPMRKFCAFVTLILICSAIGSALARPDSSDSNNIATQQILVGLTRGFKDVKEITVLASSDYVVNSANSKDNQIPCSNLEPITISAGTKTMTLRRPNGNTIDIGTSICVTAKDSNATISIDSPGRPSKQYHGALEVSLKSGSLSLVNNVRIEDYLVGVIAAEMPSTYPIEALKAQAVAARNYALHSRGKHKSSGYDLCDGPHCQVYDGALRETSAHRRAVISTAGQVLIYNGRLASTMYCADCGGITECSSEAHNGVAPYLTTVTEPEGTQHLTWTKTYTLAELSEKLKTDGLSAISIKKTSSSGRALAIELTGAQGNMCIDGTKLRNTLGNSTIRSTLFTIKTNEDGTVTFNGKGWGHGIGMCQVGARALASPPFNFTFDKILAHYYPGTKLTGAVGNNVEVQNMQQIAKKTPTTQAKKSSPIFKVRLVEPKL